MMGRSHAVSGVVVGLLLGKAIGLDNWSLGPFAASVAGYALLPDLDCPGSTASRRLGWITGAVSWLLCHSSAALYKITKGPRDENVKGTHRHLSHTVLFASGLAALTAGITRWAGAWGVAGVMAFGLLLAMAQIGAFAVVGASLGAVGWVTTAFAAGPGDFAATFVTAFSACSGWLGIAVAAGCITHCLGDALTEAGCPFLFPVPIAGETWYEIRPPKWLRFRTDGTFEKCFMFPGLVLCSVLAVPGVTPWLIDTVWPLLSHSNPSTS